MARHNGPVKGSVALVCEESAESTVIIAEPVILATANYAAVVGGTSKMGATITTDGLGHSYFEFAETTNTNGPVATGTRTKGAIKGMLVLSCEETASSTAFIIEPIVLSKTLYDGVLAGTEDLELNMFADATFPSVMFYEGEITAIS